MCKIKKELGLVSWLFFDSQENASGRVQKQNGIAIFIQFLYTLYKIT